MIITIDIETLPSTDPELKAEIAASITAPGQYKKPESIAEWMKENGERETLERLKKTSFDGLYGSIAVICAKVDDDDPVQSFHGPDLLERFFTFIQGAASFSHAGDQTGKSYDQEVTFIGHNIISFDLPFIKHRAMIQGVRPPECLLKAFNSKAWDKAVFDTMLAWSSDRDRRVSLDKLCRAFGIPGKGDFDGSMVADTWPVDPEKVIKYCMDDVEKTYQVYKRLTFQ